MWWVQLAPWDKANPMFLFCISLKCPPLLTLGEYSNNSSIKPSDFNFSKSGTNSGSQELPKLDVV